MKKNSLFTCLLLLISCSCFGINTISFQQNFDNKSLNFDSLELEINELDTCLIKTDTNCTALQTFSVIVKNANIDSIAINWEIRLDGDVLNAGKGNQFDYEIELNQSYLITFSVEQSTASTTFRFTDCVPPTFDLLSDVQVEFTPPGALNFYPKMVVANASDNCSSDNNLQFRAWYKYLENTRPSSLEEVLKLPRYAEEFYAFAGNFPDTQEVIIYVIDEVGNYAFDSTDIVIYCYDPCTDVPPTIVSIKGKVATAKAGKMADVEISVTGRISDIIYSDTSGQFYFYGEFYDNFFLTPDKTDAAINGVTAFDLLLIRKHILGIQPFDTPYKFLSADVDLSGTVTAFDLLTIKKVLLAKEDAFPTGQSWIFVPKNHEFKTSNPANENYPTSIEVEVIYWEDQPIEFIGIKLGDVNSNAILNKQN